jgi:putative ABC transport system permease protein
MHYLHTFMRVKPGVAIDRAQSELHSIDRWLEQAYPAENRGRRRDLLPLREMLVADSRPALLVLFGAVGLVLLIACANFASLQLARGSFRRREMAIRGALGAGRWRLVRQMLTESVLLSLLGGAAGLGLAHLGARALVALGAGSDARLLPIRIDTVVFAVTAAMAAATGLVFGLVPALAAAGVAQAGLRDGSGGQSASGGEVRLRSALVVSEIALALMLLAGAGLLIRSFRNLRSVQPGFRADHVLTMRLELPAARYEDISRQRQFRARLLETLNALPGAEAAYVSELPMSGSELTQHFVIDGRPPIPAGQEPEVLTRTVSPKYFELLRIPIRAGRAFADRDREDSPLVAIVNQSFVRAYFPSGSAVGARVSWAPDPGKKPEWMTIVGVVGDVNHFGPARPEEPAVYDPYAQTPRPWKRWMYVVVRSPAEPATLIREVTGRIWALDRQIPPTKVRQMSEVVAESTEPQKFNLLLLGAFAVLALVLASIGVYGLIAYSVARRRREIGIRMALGANAPGIVRWIVVGGVKLAAAGTAIGVIGALLVTRLMASLLFGVGPRDPATLAGVVGILALVAAVASWIPARLAVRISPISALRAE